MRVLHIVSGKLYGGVETVLVTLARYRGFCPEMEPEFALCFEGRFKAELAACGVRTHDLGEVRVRHPLSVLRARKRLREVMRERRVDVAVCHMAWAHAIFAPVIHAARVPLVFWSHGATGGKHWLERWAALSVPDFALAPNAFAAATIENIFPGVARTVFHNPVMSCAPPGDDFRAALRRELATPTDAITIVQATRMEPMKGHSCLLEALAAIRDLPQWMCWQIGAPQRPEEMQYLESLKLQAHSLGIADRVRFVGARTDVPRLLFAADIYCQANPTPEGLPIVFIEALYAGLPVVGTRVGGFSEAIDDTCGRLVPPRDPIALAAALRELILDADVRRSLGAAGPMRARSLSDPAVQIPELRSLLASVSGPDGDSAMDSGRL